jgi:hypothetical protein
MDLHSPGAQPKGTSQTDPNGNDATVYLAVVYWERSSKSPSSAAKSFPASSRRQLFVLPCIK